MPFTISHIAATVPFSKPLRRSGVLSAAMIGTMAPDFGLVLPLNLERQHTHGWLALLTFVLPLGLATWFLFQWLMKPAILEVLPDAWYVRLRAQQGVARHGSRLPWQGAATAVLAGALTHLIWDGFTHEDGLMVHVMPALLEAGPRIAGRQMLLYQQLQHVSTLVGLAIISFSLLLWIRHAHRDFKTPVVRNLAFTERSLWALTYLLIPACADLVAGYELYLDPGMHLLSADALGWLAIVGMTGLSVSMVAVSALLRVRLRISGLLVLR